MLLLTYGCEMRCSVVPLEGAAVVQPSSVLVPGKLTSCNRVTSVAAPLTSSDEPLLVGKVPGIEPPHDDGRTSHIASRLAASEEVSMQCLAVSR